MASEPSGDKKGSGDPRHIYGPRAVGALLPAITRPAFRKSSPVQAQLLADWAEIVGPALSDVTIPRRFSAGTLAIGCSGPIALELQHLSGVLIERINRHMGRDLVQKLRFVQDLLPTARPVPPPPRRVAPEKVEARLTDLPEGPIKEALRALGLAVLGRR